MSVEGAMFSFDLVSDQSTEQWLKKLTTYNPYISMMKLGDVGVQMLAEATPKDSGITAASWRYEIREEHGSYSLYFCNTSRTEDGVPIPILIQYGHALPQGGYVAPYDFINPVMEQLHKMFSEQVDKEVSP